MIRPATRDDIGKIAYFLLQWDTEIPEHLQLINGAAHAQIIATNVVNSPQFVTKLIDKDGESIGGYVLGLETSWFSLSNHGRLLMWYVEPEHRQGLHGLRLLTNVIDEAKNNHIKWLEVAPWADHRGAKAILERLGFSHLVNLFVMRI